MWKVREYYLFDPREAYMRPSLQGYVRERGFFQPVSPAADSTLASRLLGLTLARNGPYLRLTETATGAILPTPTEAERQRADAAEAEAARLRAELDRLRGGN